MATAEDWDGQVAEVAVSAIIQGALCRQAVQGCDVALIEMRRLVSRLLDSPELRLLAGDLDDGEILKVSLRCMRAAELGGDLRLPR